MDVRRIAGAAVGALIVAYFAHPLMTAGASEERNPSPVFDSQVLLEGVLFGIGPAADRLDQWEHFDPTPEQIDQIRAGAANVARTLSAPDPAYLEDFATDIQSGDPFRVEAALQDATQRIAAEYGSTTTESPSAEAAVITSVYAVQSAFLITTFVGAAFDFAVSYQVANNYDTFYDPPPTSIWATTYAQFTDGYCCAVVVSSSAMTTEEAGLAHDRAIADISAHLAR